MASAISSVLARTAAFMTSTRPVRDGAAEAARAAGGMAGHAKGLGRFQDSYIQKENMPQARAGRPTIPTNGREPTRTSDWY